MVFCLPEPWATCWTGSGFRIIDYLDFWIWPVFNLADILINIGAGLLIISIWKSEGDTDEESSFSYRNGEQGRGWINSFPASVKNSPFLYSKTDQ